MLCTLYKPPILACCSNVPCFTANRERRRAAGQLAAQENARYKGSYLRAFDPVRPLRFESWVQRDMQKGFTDELQRLPPGRCQSCGERWFAAQTPTQAAAVAEGQYTCDRCKRVKKRLSLSLLPTTWILYLCPINSRVLLRRRRCSSPKALLPCVSIAFKGGSEGTAVTSFTWRRISVISSTVCLGLLETFP